MSGSSDGPLPAKKNSRQKKWIQPDIQFRIIFSTLLVTFLTLLINFHVTLGGLFLIQQKNHASSEAAIQHVQDLLIKEFPISFGIAVPLAIWIGVIATFKFCGPIYRFKKFFTELHTGRWDAPCNLRKDDDLQDLKESINRFMALVRSKMENQQEVLRLARAALSNPAAALQGPQQAQQLLARIQEQEKDLGELFPGPAASASTPTTPTSTEAAAAPGTPGAGKQPQLVENAS